MTPFSHISADAGDSADGGVTLILVLFSLCARISGTMTPFAPSTFPPSPMTIYWRKRPCHQPPADAGDSADGGVTLIMVLLSLCARISGTMTPFAPSTFSPLTNDYLLAEKSPCHQPPGA